MIEAISITVTTPMITPMTVRNERSLLARKVPSAIQRFSVMSERKSFISLRLRAQRFNRIKSRCFPRRKQSRSGSCCGRRANADQNRDQRQIGLEENHGNDLADDPSHAHADDSANRREGNRLDEKLFHDIDSARAQRFAQTDFLGPFGYG